MRENMAGKRKCKYPRCNTSLSQYNDGNYCSVHERLGKELEAVDALPCRSESDGPSNVKQVAQKLGYSERTVRNMLNDGDILGTRLRPNGKWLISKHEVARLLGVAKERTDSAEQARRGLPAKSPNWIEEYEAKYGKLPPLPEPLGRLVKNYKPGQPVTKDMVVGIASMQLWNTIKSVPGMEKKWREFLEWKGEDPDEYELNVRRLGPPRGPGSFRLTYGPPHPR